LLHAIRHLGVFSLLICGTAQAQSSGPAPSAGLGATDVYSEFRLPPLKDWPGGPLAEKTAAPGVVKRARALGFTAGTATEAWREAEQRLSASELPFPDVMTRGVVFSGLRASALNQLLERSLWVRVSSPTLDIDEPVRITRSGVVLDLGSARIATNRDLPYLIRIEGAGNVALSGGDFEHGNSAILVNRSDEVLIQRTHIHDLAGDGIVVTHSNKVIVRDNQLGALGGSGILLHGGSASGIVERNDVTGDRGASNMSAAIVVSDRDVDLSTGGEALLGPDHYWVIAQPMSRRTNPPHNNLIAMNHLARNASSGVYIDGAATTVIAMNVIEGNAKEGLCLDNGATANVVTLNDVWQNGNRWGESDQVMDKDSIKGAGRLPDGTPAEKVPGISIDNAIYNIVFSNTVTHNFGGGVKVVRTGYFNAIGLNTIRSNNDGASEKFHFFGIELGAAPLDSPTDELDATPSRGNIIFSNVIRGDHYAGIFFAAGSDTNDVFDNLVLDCGTWALESVVSMPNSTLNNLTNRPSRNVDAGLQQPRRE
jgi:hypothetical protein